MKRPAALLLLVSLFFAGGSARAADGLAHARRAQALLGGDVWSRVIHVENTGRTHSYAKKLDALIFELAGILWFYTDADGTQSLSTYRGRLAEDKNDFGPLLREIEPGFTKWNFVPPDEAATARALLESGPLLNGCFIESVANLRVGRARGEIVGSAQLLSYYIERAGKWLGHTVLTYETPESIRVVDPLEPARVQKFSRSLADNAAGLAATLMGRAVTKAVWLRVNDFASMGTGRYAAVTRAYDTALN